MAAAAAPAAPTVAAPATAVAAPAADAAQAAAGNLGHHSASLHCSCLNPDVNEGMLYEIFKTAGAVSSIRVCRDNITRRSLGYAYINFHNLADADRALALYNFYNINGREIHLSWSMRDPSLRKSGVGNIFIKNLDKSIDNKALHDAFSEFGTILSCKVMTDEKGASRGFGFVHFEKAESAENAISKLNQMLLNDKQVYVGHHISKRERASKSEETKKNFTNVYVKFIDASVSDEVLYQTFAKFGEVTSHKIARDVSDVSKGFGFVNFAEHEAAARAVEELHNLEFHGKKLYVTRAQKRAERSADLQRRRMERQQKTQESNIYIKNLDDAITDDRLRQEFSQFGTITSAKVIVDDKGVSRGFGFVCFAEADEANKAIASMQGKNVGNKPLFLAIAMRKEQRRALLDAQHSSRNGMVGNFAPMVPTNMPFYGQPMRGNQFMYGNMRPPRFGAPAVPTQRGPYMSQPPFAGSMQRGGARRGPPRPPAAGQRPGPPRRTAFTAEQLADDGSRQALGMYFFETVMGMTAGNQPTASKVTGMLLSLNHSELLSMQNSEEELSHRIRDALEQIREAPAAEANAVETH